MQKDRISSISSQNSFGKLRTPSSTSQNGFDAEKSPRSLRKSTHNGFNGSANERFSTLSSKNNTEKERILSDSSHNGIDSAKSTLSQNGSLKDRSPNSSIKDRLPSSSSQNGSLKDKPSQNGSLKDRFSSTSSQNGSVKDRLNSASSQNGSVKDRLNSASSQNGSVKDRSHSASSQNGGSVKDRFSSTSSQNSSSKPKFSTSISSGKGSGKVLERVAFLNQKSQQDDVSSNMERKESWKKDMKSVQAPRLIKRLEDCNAKEGNAGKFKCKFNTTSGELKVEWFRNDEKLEESKQYSMLIEADHVFILVVTRCTPDIEGIFTCEATNKRGSVKTSANLYVECLHVVNNHKMNGDITEEGVKHSEKECVSHHAKEKKKVEVQRDDVGNIYELHETLGRGKFGEVKKCTHKESKKDFAAKFIKCRPSQKKTVLNEIDILNSLNHKNIIQLVDAYEYGGQFVLVQELVSGGELFEKLIDEEFISEMDVSLYIEQLLHALKHMHDLGIIHLDLKPENIMLVEKNSTVIKLIDFGVARRMEKDLKVTYGTTEFLSPEVVNYDPVTPGSDMWTVGVIMYVLVSGYSPFSGDNDLETLGNISRCNWDFDDPAFDDISDEAKDFISKLLIKAPRTLDHWKSRTEKKELSNYTTSLAQGTAKFEYKVQLNYIALRSITMQPVPLKKILCNKNE